LERRAFLARGGLSVAAFATGCVRTATEPEPLSPPVLEGEAIQFATGVENSAPLLPGGRRVDQLAKCGHYDHWADDFGLMRELGIGAVRYGPPLYRVLPAPGLYDWAGLDDQMAWLERSGISVFADLCHFGVPDWMSGLDDPGLPAHLAAYAGAFARRYSWVRHYTPVNEIYVAALFSAYHGWWNEARRGEAAFVRTLVNLCRAHELAVEAILRERPDAVIVQSESFERYEPVPHSASAAAAAARWNELRCLGLDLTLGRPLSPVLAAAVARAGVRADLLEIFAGAGARGRRWLGADYYAGCEQIVREDGSRGPASRRAGLAAVVRSYCERYRLPVYLTETNREEPRAVEWLHEQWAELLLLRAGGVPVRGFTWYGLTDSVDWSHLLREDRGEADPVGLRALDRSLRPVGTAYGDLIARWRPTLGARSERLASGSAAG
jgi:beta-glucosidase/6-phospho-beta-glucosidase/beta-galactosidase